MTNAFVRALSLSPEPASACARLDHLYVQLHAQPFFSAVRDTIVREIWSETAFLACHLAHDQGLADLVAAIPRSSARLSDWATFFASIVRLAQTTAEPPISADTLRRFGLLPTWCTLTLDEFHHRAVHVIASLDHGQSSCARHTMQQLVAACTFAPDTRAERD